ncbi:hypothetical protein [Lachnoanaerobaculum orale]|nr:hypothetical protein [Lachnoanaerobaculum orale]
MREEYDISILKYPVIKLDTILKSCKWVILIKNKENFMNQYICNYRTIGDISTTDISFLPSVYNFYKNDIIMPKKSLDDMILLLSKDYGLTKVLYSELDRMTAESAISMINYNTHKNNPNIPTNDIWQLPQNLATSRFYTDFYERFVKIGDSPKIILIYIPDKDYFMSNSSFFETAIYVYRGINEDDFNKKGPQYKHYLNNMFLLSESLKMQY